MKKKKKEILLSERDHQIFPPFFWELVFQSRANLVDSGEIESLEGADSRCFARGRSEQSRISL
jgi:hypothetical protein